MGITIGEFELEADHIKMLLTELKDENIKNEADLKKYLKNYSHLADNGRKCHLLLSPKKKGRNFAIPFK